MEIDEGEETMVEKIVPLGTGEKTKGERTIMTAEDPLQGDEESIETLVPPLIEGIYTHLQHALLTLYVWKFYCQVDVLYAEFFFVHFSRFKIYFACHIML